MNKKLVALFSSATLLALPIVAFATPRTDLTLDSVTGALLTVISNFIWPLFIGFAIIMFIISGVHFLNNKPDEGKSSLIWGIVGVAVGVLAFSLPYIVATLLGSNIKS